MGYLLMDHETANSIGGYRTEREALTAVLDTIERYGADSPEVRSLSLARTHGDPRAGFIAAGADLVKRALALRTRRAPARRRKRAVA